MKTLTKEIWMDVPRVRLGDATPAPGERDAAWTTGVFFELDGCMNARGQAQIQWQQRYHASLRKPRGEAIERASAAR